MRNLLLKPYKCSMSPYKNFLNIQIGVSYNKPTQVQTNENNINTIVKNFYEKAIGVNEEIVPIQSISKTMKDVLKTKITPQDYFNFQPFTDELALLTGKLNFLEKKPYVTQVQAKILLQFGITFQIQDKDYWKFVLDSLEQQISNLSFQETLGVMTLLKQDSHINSNIVQKSFSHFKELLPSAVVEDLVSFVILYVNPTYNKLLGTQDVPFEEKLEYYLIKRLESKSLKPNDFSHICRALSFQLNKFNLRTFFYQSIPFVQTWIKSQSLSIDQLCFIARVYSNFNTEEEKLATLFSKIEESLIQNCELIKLNEAIDLVQSMHEYASEDLLEILDRIIGAQIYEVHVDDLVPVLKAFSSNNKSREKILYILIDRIRQKLNNQSLQKLIDYTTVLANFNGDVEYYMDTIESYLLNFIDQFREEDVLSLLKVFNSSKMTRNYEIKEILEQMVLDNYLNYSYSTIIEILNFYASNRIGESVLIQSLLTRINNKELKNAEYMAKINKQKIIKTIVTLNMCGQNDNLEIVIGEIEKRLDQFDQKELYLVLQCLPGEGSGYEGLKNKINDKLSQK